jgi:hypothetical protein
MSTIVLAHGVLGFGDLLPGLLQLLPFTIQLVEDCRG